MKVYFKKLQSMLDVHHEQAPREYNLIIDFNKDFISNIIIAQQ